MGTPLNEDGLDTIFRTARTYNGYLPGEVTEADIRAIYELLKMGPTSANMQPARFVWCLSQEAKDRLADCASATNAPKIRTAPAAVVIGMDHDYHEQLPWLFPHTDAKSWFPDPEARKAHALRNSSLQGAYFLVAARALGWVTGPMARFDPRAVDAVRGQVQPASEVQRIEVVGYTDRIGSASYNQALSQRRAEAVRRALVDGGVAAEAIRAEGRGDAEPLVQCDQRSQPALIACLAPNRRVQISGRARID